jgi:hypothetical protein
VENMQFLSTGRTKVRSVKCCILFDPADGAIRHVHRVVTMEGADEIAEHLIEKRTLQLAKELGVDVSGLDLLHVDACSIEPHFQYAVDPKKRCLVATKRIIDRDNMSEPRPSQPDKC